MFDDVDPADHTPGSLRDAYERVLREAIETAGIAEVAAATGIEREAVGAIAADGAADRSLSDAAAVLAVAGDRDAETLLADARDRLLLGMSTAVLDVETLAGRLDGDLPAKELQAKIEGRHPMTLGEYARVQAAIAEEM